MNKYDVIVVGAGAAGMMAALTAAEGGAAVALLERNERPGRKLYITGKGRCNLTNDCTAEEALRAIPCNGKFLYSAMRAFPPGAVKEKFEALGVPLKTERGGRVFPVSDRATDVIDALVRALRRHGAPILRGQASGLIIKNGAVLGVQSDTGDRLCTRVIVAAGGVSYPLTGSTGDGYGLARAAGHTVIDPKPSLVPLVSPDGDCAAMQGLSLRNVTVTVKSPGGKACFSEQGEMLFTHFGLSGPLILSASAHMRDWSQGSYTVSIDLKPALDEAKLDARLLRDFAQHQNRDMGNFMDELAPRVMGPILCRRAGIAPETKVHSVTREGRRRLIETLKNFNIEITKPRPIAEAIVTSGGVKVSELDPKTMASKLVRGLYFAGEVIDVDGYTGGFNLQIAWSTGYAAGSACRARHP